MLKKKVLFICTYNSVRSQMAEGLLRAYYGDKFEVYSAGLYPSGVNSNAIKVMKEIGIDISGQRSKVIDEFRTMKFDYCISVCDQTKETCPFFPSAVNYIHKVFVDPGKFQGEEREALNVFRRSRDEIKKWIEKIFKDAKRTNYPAKKEYRKTAERKKANI